MLKEAQSIYAAQWLAEQGTQQCIVESMFGKSTAKLLKPFYKRAPKNMHRYGVHWLRIDGAYQADRVYRLFVQIFGKDALSNAVNGVDFAMFCQTYLAKFPSDDMSANRIHYLMQSILNGDAVVYQSCNCCGQPYVMHKDDKLFKTCNICRTLAEEKK
jgi:hypothetical protein